MKRKIAYILSAISLIALLPACSDNTPEQKIGDETPITGIIATLGDADEARANVSLKDEEYIGRKDFADGDRIIFTKICRTVNPIDVFTYSDIEWLRTSGSWSRLKDDGSPERIYWSDALNSHTFIAYSTPNQLGAGEFDWELRDGKYYGTIGAKENTTDSVSFSSIYTAGAINPADSGAIKLRKEDLVLHYSTDMHAQPSGSIALVQFRHALSYVQVTVGINGFSAGAATEDNKSRVWGLTILNQPVKYCWDGMSDKAEPVEGSVITKDFKACCFNPAGKNVNQYRQFTFNSLAVPTTASGRNFQVRFMVTYPDPLSPTTKTITRAYTAQLDNLVLPAGKRTTINIQLNHKNESMTVGAVFGDWEDHQTIDDGNLTKKSTFLTTTDRSTIKTHKEVNTADDATWLYTPTDSKGYPLKDANGWDIIYDIYGNDGYTIGNAYTISTAEQLLAFAYEVNEGMTFRDHGVGSIKYIRLDANLTLQPKLYTNVSKITETEKAGLVEWIGIGDSTHPFNGVFLGYRRQINNLYGKPLLGNVDNIAVIERLVLTKIIEVNGNGAIVEENKGTIAASILEGNVTGTQEHAGSIVGSNSGIIISCCHTGDVKAPNYIGGILGRNIDKGIVLACFHTGAITATAPGAEGTHISGIVVENDENAIIRGCYYNSDFLTPTDSSGSQGKNTIEMQVEGFVTTINNDIQAFYDDYKDRDIIPTNLLNRLLYYKYTYYPASYPVP